MKANELMIGDWVNYQPGDTPQYMKVGMVSGYDVQLDLYREGGIEMAAQVWFDEEGYVQPIPLTPEILEKNGWYIPEDGLWYRHDVIGFLIALRTSGAYLYADEEHDRREFFCSIHFVHELQHALRLCGIEKEIKL